MSAFRIEKREKGAEFLVAARDIQPGEEILTEERPLMFCPGEYMEQYTEMHMREEPSLLAYRIYNQRLSKESQQRMKKLFSVAPEWHLNKFSRLGSAIQIQCPLASGGVRKFTQNELRTFIRVCNAVRLHGVQMRDGVCVYEYKSKFTHSCIPNSVGAFDNDVAVYRAVTQIKSGDMLTLSTGPYCSCPTHERREIYLLLKDCTCHCPRCDAEADDTREFDCHDPQCPGSHFACQPRCTDPPDITGLHYTGVEYVEPHLLPCTVCQCAAPLKYQQDMFALERQLVPTFDAILFDMKYLTGFHRTPAQLVDMCQNFKYPRLHIRSEQYIKFTFTTWLGISQLEGSRSFGELQRVAEQYMTFLLHHNRHANSSDPRKLLEITTLLLIGCTLSQGLYKVAKECAERALRMHLLICGREDERTPFDSALIKVLQRLPPQLETTAQCMFCKESPLRAALTLSRCGRCRQVAYCSVGCQKAHWPLHKKGCKKTA